MLDVHGWAKILSCAGMTSCHSCMPCLSCCCACVFFVICMHLTLLASISLPAKMVLHKQQYATCSSFPHSHLDQACSYGGLQPRSELGHFGFACLACRKFFRLQEAPRKILFQKLPCTFGSSLLCPITVPSAPFP